jgi:hypothetical protein
VQDADKLGEGQLFMSPAFYQADKATFRWPDRGPSPTSKGLTGPSKRIVKQGRGDWGGWATAHYGRLLTMLGDYLAMRDEDPDFEPAYRSWSPG